MALITDTELAGTGTAQGANLVGFIQAGGAVAPRTVMEKLREIVSVRDFGAVGNGSTNDTAAIIAADANAAQLGKDLFLPAGTYMIEAETQATTNWRGEAGTILRYLGTSPTFVRLVYASGVNNILFENLIFNGSASDDPSAWTSSNYDSFTGASGLSVENCDRPTVRNCRSQNTRQHGFRFVNCPGASWVNCTTHRSRGNFGDGFIATASIGLSVSACAASDYTRIGFVVDNIGQPTVTNHKVTFSQCFASHGHDASVLHGGGEFNAGFWLENTGDAAFEGCFAFDNAHVGINACTGSSTNDFPGSQALFTLSNCHSVGGRWGIRVYSLGALAVSAKITNCSAKGAVTAFEGAARNAADSFAWLNCHADYDASSNVGRGFATECPDVSVAGKPSFLVGPGCTISRFAENKAYLDDTGDAAATADVGGYFNPMSPMRLTVDGVRHTGDKPIYVRWYEGAAHDKAHDFIATNVDMHVRRGGSTGGVIKAKNATLRSFTVPQGNADAVEITGCTILGPVMASAKKIDLVGGSVSIADSSSVWLLSPSNGKYPAILVNGTRFEKNIANGEVLRLGFGTVSFSTIVTGCTFYNSGSPDAAHAFVTWAAGAVRYWNGNFADDSVANITMLDSGGGAETGVIGVEKIAMH